VLSTWGHLLGKGGRQFVDLMVKNMCFLLRGHKFKSREGWGMCTSVDFTSQIAKHRIGGRLSHKQGGPIHQFGVYAIFF
jgi:hypothetical protein